MDLESDQASDDDEGESVQDDSEYTNIHVAIIATMQSSLKRYM